MTRRESMLTPYTDALQFGSQPNRQLVAGWMAPRSGGVGAGRRHDISFPESDEVPPCLDHSGRNVIVGVAVLVGIAGLSYVLAVRPRRPKGGRPLVEFTPDGKLKRPVGYRQWVYVGTSLTPNDLNGGEATFPEFHAVYIDPESFAALREDRRVPRRHRDDQGTHQRRRQGGDQRQGLLHGRVHAAWRRRSRTRSASRTSPASGPTSASATSIRSRRRRRRTLPPRATSATRTTPRRTGSSASTTPSCGGGPACEVKSARRVRVGPVPATPASPNPRRHLP